MVVTFIKFTAIELVRMENSYLNAQISFDELKVYELNFDELKVDELKVYELKFDELTGNRSGNLGLIILLKCAF